MKSKKLRDDDHRKEVFGIEPNTSTLLNFISKQGSQNGPVTDLLLPEILSKNRTEMDRVFRPGCIQGSTAPVNSFAFHYLTSANGKGDLSMNQKDDLSMNQVKPNVAEVIGDFGNLHDPTSRNKVDTCDQEQPDDKPVQRNLSNDRKSAHNQIPEISDPLISGVYRLAQLQRLLCEVLSEEENDEIFCSFLINELRSSRDIYQYQKMPCELLCMEVQNRELMTLNLVTLLRKRAFNVQLRRCIQFVLTEEFGFIGQLKRTMLAKSFDVQDEHRAGFPCAAESSSASASAACGSAISNLLGRDAGQHSAGITAEEEVGDRVSDSSAQTLLNDENNVLMFSEPGKVFHFEVQPGRQFVEKWRQRGSGIVSLYKDETAELVTIVICHWSTQRNYSVIHVRPSMKTKFTTSGNGLELKFMGLEVSGGQEKMRYFMIQFETPEVANSFKNLIMELPFLNISANKDNSCSSCCLDVRFKSLRIHEEFPYVISESEHSGITLSSSEDICSVIRTVASDSELKFNDRLDKTSSKEIILKQSSDLEIQATTECDNLEPPSDEFKQLETWDCNVSTMQQTGDVDGLALEVEKSGISGQDIAENKTHGTKEDDEDNEENKTHGTKEDDEENKTHSTKDDDEDDEENKTHSTKDDEDEDDEENKTHGTKEDDEEENKTCRTKEDDEDEDDEENKTCSTKDEDDEENKTHSTKDEDDEDED